VFARRDCPWGENPIRSLPTKVFALTPSDTKPRISAPRAAEPDDQTHVPGHVPDDPDPDPDPVDDATYVRDDEPALPDDVDDPEAAISSAFDRRLEPYTQAGLSENARSGKALVGGRYRLQRAIGAGSMGRIFLAEQVSVGRRIAVKVINRELTGRSDALIRFQQEARLLASISSEHIVEVYDIGETEHGDPFIAMEYVDGPSLATIIREQAPMHPARVLRLLLQAANALATVHATGVVHRDLKPANMVILARKDGFEIMKILDFGLAKVMGDRESGGRLTRAGVIIGTPEYMSPEQVTAGQVDHRADLYALGCTAYEMLSGQPPFTGPEMSTLYKHMHEDPPPLGGGPVAVPEPIAKVVMRCLAKEPDRRYQSALELHTALVVAADDAGIPRRELRIPRLGLEDPVEVHEHAPAASAPAPRGLPPEAARLGSGPQTRGELVLLVATTLAVGITLGVFIGRARSVADDGRGAADVSEGRAAGSETSPRGEPDAGTNARAPGARAPRKP
jgi:serine/threonine-protein kinase